jgi:opacity protein-like surface antigen
MKLSNHRAIALSTLLFTPVLSLQAQDRDQIMPPPHAGPDLYVQGEAGPAYMQDLQVNVGTKEEFKFNVGTRVDLAVGYNFSRSWSTELNFGMIWNSIDKYGGYSFGASKQAEVYQIPVMWNYLYRLPLKGRLEGFVGAGLGLVAGVLHINDRGLDFKDSDVTFGGQGVAGLNYHFTRQMDLSLTYKFLGTSNHRWTDGDYYTKTDGTLTHALLLGLSLKY